MSIDKETEMKTGMDMAALAEQRDDERQQAEAEAAQKMLQHMLKRREKAFVFSLCYFRRN